MKKLIKLLTIVAVVFFVLSTNSFADNNYPIILVHGWMGWGEGEFNGYNYWGGKTSIKEKLEDAGYEVYVASIGPFSSNWDRSAELYANIKGGYVDYGKAHSEKNDHLQIPITKHYTGLYPEWGEINPETGEINKVHIIGHSMGGTTARMIAQLLENGHPEEIALSQEDPTYDLSPLYAGEKETKDWIASISTISSNHDGSTLVDGVLYIVPSAQELFLGLASFTGHGDEAFFDFDLDQWGLQKLLDENFIQYRNSVLSSDVLNNKDIGDMSDRDLSPEGMRDINGWVEAQDNIYYFSISTYNTRKASFRDVHRPILLTMNPLLVPGSFFLGSYTVNNPDRVQTDKSWFKNDGMVNTISMNGPKINSNDLIIDYNERDPIQKGIWQHLGTYQMDHYDIIGVNALQYDTWNEIGQIYLDLAEKLSEL